MDLVEQIHIFGLTNIHTFGPNISLLRLFNLMLNYEKPRIFDVFGHKFSQQAYQLMIQIEF